MIGIRKSVGLGAALAAGVGLCGCVTLFPKTTPAQMYRFGETVDVLAPSAAPGVAPISVFHAPTTFVAAASGDRILTSTGRETAYIASARWVSPAAVLFDEAETRVFSEPNGPVQLVARGQAIAAPLSLHLTVETFEARYGDSPASAPTVVVVIRGDLTRLADRQILIAKTFEVDKPAADNRVGPIVDAFDGATSDALRQVAAWTAQQAAAAPAVKP